MQFRSATTVEEALSQLAELGSDARLLAGGTDVMMQVQRGELRPEVLVHIEKVPGLGAVEVNGHVGIGALVTHRTLATDPTIRARYTSVAQAAATVGGWQTQAVGTVGGNVCNASPAADLTAPLLVHDAVVQLRSTGGTRSVPLAEFVLGRRRVDRRDDELVVGFELADAGERRADDYVKVARRGAMEVAVVGVAVSIGLDEDLSTITSARVAACSVADVPFRAVEAEGLLTGADPDGDLSAAGEALAARAEPIDDARSSASYRRRVLPGVLARAVTTCVDRIRTSAN